MRNTAWLKAIVSVSLTTACAGLPTPPAGSATFEPVRVEGDDKGALVERRTAATNWSVVCGVPCYRTLNTSFVYRISGDNIPASDPFLITGPTTVRVHTGSAGYASGGTLLIVIGIPLMIVGALMVSVPGDKEDHVNPWGIGTLLAGSAAVGGGMAVTSIYQTRIEVQRSLSAWIPRVALSF
jgi:hypothetical protein